eukprot:SAG31_NODE_2588_length_5419_cov_15.402778_4_plen_66_part_00
MGYVLLFHKLKLLGLYGYRGTGSEVPIYFKTQIRARTHVPRRLEFVYVGSKYTYVKYRIRSTDLF